MCFLYCLGWQRNFLFLPRLFRLSTPKQIIKVLRDQFKIMERSSWLVWHTVAFLTLIFGAVAYYLVMAWRGSKVSSWLHIKTGVSLALYGIPIFIY